MLRDNGKMTDPLGASLAAADTSLVESQYAWNSLTDFHNNIQSALNIYTGIKGFNPNCNAPRGKSSNGGVLIFGARVAVVAILVDGIINAEVGF